MPMAPSMVVAAPHRVMAMPKMNAVMANPFFIFAHLCILALPCLGTVYHKSGGGKGLFSEFLGDVSPPGIMLNCHPVCPAMLSARRRYIQKNCILAEWGRLASVTGQFQQCPEWVAISIAYGFLYHLKGVDLWNQKRFFGIADTDVPWVLREVSV